MARVPCKPNIWGCQYQLKGKFCVKRAVINFLCCKFFILGVWFCYPVLHHTKYSMIDVVSLSDILHTVVPVKQV